MSRNKSLESLDDKLELILKESKDQKMTLGRVCQILSGRGYAVLLILFSLPFCFPISIPGLSTPFGLLLAFLGLRLAFGKRLWWPKWILAKEVSHSTLKSVIGKLQGALLRLEKVLHPRLLFLVKHPLAHRLHGLLIFALSLFLSLPLPIPFSNTLSALPLLCLGLGLLEDDGVLVIIAYSLSLVCFLFFGFIFWYGGANLYRMAAFF